MKIVLLLLVGALFAACSSIAFKAQRPEKYAQTNPKFVIQDQLGGPLVSEGVLFGPTGSVSTRFVAKMQGTWNADGTGTLREEFVYDNGTEQVREWNLVLGENGTLTGTAADVVGTAQGNISGSTLRLKYKIRLTEAAGGHVLDVVDWIYLTEDGTMINKAVMSKFGIKVAELVGNIRPEQ